MTAHPDAELVEAARLAGALRAEQDRDTDQCDEMPRGADREALWRTITARTERYLAEIARVIELPATSRAGIEAKARTVALYFGEGDGDPTSLEEALGLSLARDVLRLVDRANTTSPETSR